MLVPAIRLVTAKGKAPQTTLQLLCHVKPGVKSNREGIAAVSDEAVEVCVAAQAKEGEANKAVREVIAEVSLPQGSKSSFHLTPARCSTYPSQTSRLLKD